MTPSDPIVSALAAATFTVTDGTVTIHLPGTGPTGGRAIADALAAATFTVKGDTVRIHLPG